MTKYRKKPVVIEVNRWFEGSWVEGVCFCDSDTAHVHTAHAGQRIDLESGDYVVAEPDGNGFYPVKPDIFEATYERVDE